jgi:hypothetical protein
MVLLLHCDQSKLFLLKNIPTENANYCVWEETKKKKEGRKVRNKYKSRREEEKRQTWTNTEIKKRRRGN